jgi:DNA-binding transcriptional LysR family regulator
MELRQLRYFVAVAEELNFSRAAERVHVSGPALSQAIIALERDLRAELFVRDRRSVRLTEVGQDLLVDARELLAMAEGIERRVRQRTADTTPVRIGYVSWFPDSADTLVSPVAIRIDDWVLPSHAQAERVMQGSLDLAVAWVTTTGATDLGLTAHLLRAEPLRALVPGRGTASPVPAARLTVLVDGDQPAWSSWNRFAREFAAATGARTVTIDDGGITGEAFHAHVRRLGTAVLTSPKRHHAATPPGLVPCSVVDPTPLWTWSLLHRADDDRPDVRHVVQSLQAFAHTRHWDRPTDDAWWIPADDPHAKALTAP